MFRRPDESRKDPADDAVERHYDAIAADRADVVDSTGRRRILWPTAHGLLPAAGKRVLDGIYREFAPVFEHAAIDHDAFRRAVAERTSEYVGSR